MNWWQKFYDEGNRPPKKFPQPDTNHTFPQIPKRCMQFIDITGGLQLQDLHDQKQHSAFLKALEPIHAFSDGDYTVFHVFFSWASN